MTDNNTFYAAAAHKFQADAAEHGNELFAAQAEIERLRAELNIQRGRAEAWRKVANDYDRLANIAREDEKNAKSVAETWKSLYDDSNRCALRNASEVSKIIAEFRALRDKLSEITSQRDMLAGAMREFFEGVKGETYAYMFGTDVQKLREALEELDGEDEDQPTKNNVSADCHDWSTPECPICGIIH